MSETKAAFAEGLKRSQKNKLDRYLEVYGYKYFPKLTKFVTTQSSRGNCSIDLILKTVRNPAFCPFRLANHYEKLGNPSLNLDTDIASRSMAHISGTVTSHSLHRNVFKWLKFLPEKQEYTQ